LVEPVPQVQPLRLVLKRLPAPHPLKRNLDAPVGPHRHDPMLLAPEVQHRVEGAIRVALPPPDSGHASLGPREDAPSRLRFLLASLLSQVLKEAQLVPLLFRRSRAALLACLADHPRHERLEPLADELLDLHCEHFGRVHLAVEELHDAAKLRGDHVRYKNHSDPPCLEVRLDPLPELLDATPRTQELPDLLLRVPPALPAAFLKASTDGL